MRRYNKNLGDFGEEAAAEYLKSKGYKILERNFRVKRGEIDIIASDDGVLVFVEVKTRSSEKYGIPAEAVNYQKRIHMRAAAEEYFGMHPTDAEIRFDIAEVYAAVTDGVPQVFEINHICGCII